MRNLFTLILLFVFTNVCLAQNAPSQKAYQPPVSLLENGGFEAGKAGWTSSGGTFAIATSGSNLLVDKASATFDASATSQYIQSKLYTVPNGMYGSSCSASFEYLGGDTNLKLVVLDGTAAVLATRTLESAATIKRSFGTTFQCPTSGTFRVRLESTADAAIIALDKFKLGELDTFQVGAAKYVGAIEWAPTGSCTWPAAATSFTSIPADTDCPAPSVSGELSAPPTKVPGFIVQGPGDFLVTANFRATHSSVADGRTALRLSNGTNHSSVVVANTTNGNTTTNDSWSFIISLPSGSHTVQLQASSVNAATFEVLNSSGPSGQTVNFNVVKFPTASETAYRPETINWKVDANISGANPSLGTSSVATYTSITNASLTLTNNSGSLPAQIPCSSTNPSTGTTCSAGTEDIGIAFNLPAAGDVLACVSFSHDMYLASAGDNLAVFQIDETPNNSQTTTSAGKTRLQSHGYSAAGTLQVGTPIRLCSPFTFVSAGQKTLRLKYEQYNSTGVINSSFIMADGDGAAGQRDIHWEVYPITQHVPAPVIVNSVVTPYSGVASIASASVSAAAPGVASNESGDWINGTCARTGVNNSTATCVFNSGVFSAAPVCTATINNGNYRFITAAATSSQVVVTTGDVSGTQSAEAFDLICIGTK